MAKFELIVPNRLNFRVKSFYWQNLTQMCRSEEWEKIRPFKVNCQLDFRFVGVIYDAFKELI